MSASTPVWVPLTIAVVGLATTVGAGLLAQWQASRREDRRWDREREARREDWHREDSHRWLQDRRQVYARFIIALDAWTSEIGRARSAVAVGNVEHYNEKTPEGKLDDLQQATEEMLAEVELMGPV
jgi:hypothetical protein